MLAALTLGSIGFSGAGVAWLLLRLGLPFRRMEPGRHRKPPLSLLRRLADLMRPSWGDS
jgi:hypothetical protein